MKTLGYAVFLFLVILSAEIVSALSAVSPWQLVWRDEFDGTGRPSAAKWNFHVGPGWNNGANDFLGWGNAELEWYRPENCYLQNGKLVIKATYQQTSFNGRTWDYRSCRITSDTRRSILYGAVEARIRMPTRIATWPAFWMMGDACDDTSTNRYRPPLSYYDTMASNWSSCGEIDIMEHRNAETATIHNLFWDTRTGLFPWDCCANANNPSAYRVGNVAQFHVYRLEWSPSQLQWFVDGRRVKTQDITPTNMEEFHQPFHVIFNLAVGGAFTGHAQPNPADFPLYMSVDYIRVYRLRQ